jgi:hypothetical protein
MKIQQVRAFVAEYDEETLRKLISEIYKCIPKKVIEEKQVDLLLENPQVYLGGANKPAKKIIMPDMDEVRGEVEAFVINARAQNYLVPNRVISKSERPKWRFLVKRLYKDLLTLSQEPEDLLETGKLLMELYKVLCEACRINLFTAVEPFGSVGVEQRAFYHHVIAVNAHAKQPDEWIKEAILLIVEQDVDGATSYSSLMRELVEHLETAPLRETGIKWCETLRRGKPVRRSSSKYELEQRNNHLTELLFRIRVALSEKEAAIADFKRHYRDSSTEVELYVLMRLLLEYEEKELWLREFENSRLSGVHPRQSLVKDYEQIKETGELPKYLG